MSLNNRLKELVSHFRLTQKDFAENTGLPQTTFNKAVKGDTSPRHDFFYGILVRYKNVNARWLITGEGSMLNNLSNHSSDDIHDNSPPTGHYERLYVAERERNSLLERELGKIYAELEKKESEIKELNAQLSKG